MRIVSSVAKTSYALSWLIVGLWIDVLLLTAGSALPFISLAFSLAALIVGVRTFRGAEEPVGPPRAWWRATATTRSSIVMSAIFFAAGVLQLSALITSPWNEHNPRVNVYVAIAVFLAAAFFAHSAWRQSRLPPATSNWNPQAQVATRLAPPRIPPVVWLVLGGVALLAISDLIRFATVLSQSIAVDGERVAVLGRRSRGGRHLARSRDGRARLEPRGTRLRSSTSGARAGSASDSRH